MKDLPILQIMFCVVLLAFSIIGISSYYGESDWTWMGEQIAGFFLIFIVFGVGFFTLMSWRGKR